MVSKRTNTNLVEEMSSRNIEETAKKTQEDSALKWKARENYQDIPKTLHVKTVNKLRAVPNSWCKLVNTMVKQCPKCKEKGVICNRWHLKYAYNPRAFVRFF